VGQFFKKLQKLMILDPVHIFLFPIQGKIARGNRIWAESFEKSVFQAQNGLFVVLTTMTKHTKTHMGT
jgi:hypothetical protein